MGALSRLTGDSRYERAALRALRKLWSMRSSLNLLGTTLNVLTGEWIEYSSGIGAGKFLFVCLCWHSSFFFPVYKPFPTSLFIFLHFILGVDSFYEYLMKAYILFGSDEFWDMFHSAYLAVQKYFRHGPWYILLCWIIM
jgi:ER degradation enhancer, mannosidase alpha-like 1